jgi:hypothetical protein
VLAGGKDWYIYEPCSILKPNVNTLITPSPYLSTDFADIFHRLCKYIPQTLQIFHRLCIYVPQTLQIYSTDFADIFHRLCKYIPQTLQIYSTDFAHTERVSK